METKKLVSVHLRALGGSVVNAKHVGQQACSRVTLFNNHLLSYPEFYIR